MWRGAAVERQRKSSGLVERVREIEGGRWTRYMKRFRDGEIRREVLLPSNSVFLFRSW
jgi:hypothetical protein